MADSLGGPQRTDKLVGSERQIEQIGSKNSRYNATVRANNKRIGEGRGSEMKRLPRGKAADQRWKSSGR